MQTYIRVSKKFHERLARPLEGLVYQKASATEPSTAGDLAGRVLAHLKAHPEDGTAAPEEIHAVIESLALRGFLAQPQAVPARA